VAEPVCPVRLTKKGEDALRSGMPWIYASDVIDSSEPLLAPPGSLVAIETQKGQRLGTGYFNAKSQIACRVLTLGNERIDAAFFKNRIGHAMASRDRMIGVPYYRAVHSEADGLPGLLIDRFGDALAVQTGTAGMELLQPLWLEALGAFSTIVLRNDIAARTLEGLKREVSVLKGEPPELVEVEENGCIYYADIVRGQKTGWFYDQRDNRKMIAELSPGKTLVDIYSHSGGFGVIAAKAGAKQVTMVDSSKLALELAEKAAARNGVKAETLQGDAFEVMADLHQQGVRYDIVLADPPAFVKARKDIASGLKGYEKVARLAAALVAPEGGLLFVASCSHHAARSGFNKAVLGGVKKAGLRAGILRQTGAAPDHPRHKCLAQNEYLKGVLLKIG
jgi:23S rRNA (cytosine1962-C5)-methyltransferase